MPRYNAKFTSIDDFNTALAKFNPDISEIKEINGEYPSHFGRFNNVALTFVSSPDKIGKLGQVMGAFKPRKQTFFVSKNYKCVPFEEVSTTIINTIEKKYKRLPDAAYAQFSPGRVQFLLDYRDKIEVSTRKLDLVPFERSVENADILDYDTKDAGDTEAYSTSIYCDVGFNGRTGIIVYPAYVRSICTNLMLYIEALIRTASIRHLGEDILDNIKLDVDTTTTALTDQYIKALDFGEFMTWAKRFFGVKAYKYIEDLKFRKDVQDNFKLYYALQTVTMLSRGIESDSYNVKGYGLAPKSALAIKQITRMAA